MLQYFMTHYNVSVAITVWKTMTKTQGTFVTTAGVVKHVDHTSKEVCTLSNGYLRVCYVKPGYVIYLITFQ